MGAERGAADRVFVALDVERLEAAAALLDRLEGILTGCKIGNQLFTAAGPAALDLAHRRGFRVFLDLKFHDIPNTVAGAVREATRTGVFMLNVHASGGHAMMRAAAESAAQAAAEFKVTRPICLGVTVLTSLDRRALDRELGVPRSVEAHVLHLAELARAAGLDGCVASPQEVGALRRALGPRWIIVTPGIRGGAAADSSALGSPGAHTPGSEGRPGSAGEPRALGGPGGHTPGPEGRPGSAGEPRALGGPGGHTPGPEGRPGSAGEPRALGGPGGHVGAPRPKDDQQRVATAAGAVQAGADFLVVGRPITAAADPASAARAILEELGHA